MHLVWELLRRDGMVGHNSIKLWVFQTTKQTDNLLITNQEENSIDLNFDLL